MLTKIAKEFKWEMSHRLSFHQGPCRNIHGHTYRMVFEAEGTLDENSMVLDYYHVEQIIRPWIDKLDHAFLCDEKDELMINFLSQNGFKMHIMPYVSTAENMVTYFLDIFAEEFRRFDNISSIKVRILETEDVYAERSISLI
jgi:6-pyruvoyltetrahydropterin/6-carboxytetrahydropterin synthase